MEKEKAVRRKGRHESTKSLRAIKKSGELKKACQMAANVLRKKSIPEEHLTRGRIAKELAENFFTVDRGFYFKRGTLVYEIQAQWWKK